MDELEDLDLSLDDILEANENEDDGLTAGQILHAMEEAWINEKLAPEILPHKMEIAECLYLQVEEMDKNLELLPIGDVKRCAHELELRRIRFLLSSYLRVRLLKIESYAQYIMEQEENRRNNDEELYLSNSETTFLLSYKNITEKYMNEIYNFVPEYVQDESKEQRIKPNLHSYVFFQSKNTINGVVVDADNLQDDVVDINKGSKMIMPYDSIRNFLKSNDIQLI